MLIYFAYDRIIRLRNLFNHFIFSKLIVFGLLGEISAVVPQNVELGLEPKLEQKLPRKQMEDFVMESHLKESHARIAQVRYALLYIFHSEI